LSVGLRELLLEKKKKKGTDPRKKKKKTEGERKGDPTAAKKKGNTLGQRKKVLGGGLKVSGK